jgi:GNAT superfamily N-acetyltransferase
LSVLVRPADEGDIEAVCDLLHDNMSAKISKDCWRRLLDYPWRPPDAPRGCVAVHDGRAVGFMGLVFADRPVEGQLRRFCNMCAWYLLKDYRGQGIGRRMQFDSVTDPEITYTNLTATEAAGRAFAECGFRVLDRERYIIRRVAGFRPTIGYMDAAEAIEPLLDPAERQILQDHRSYNVRHLLLTTGDDACYVVLQVKRKGDDIDYYEVMHASSPRFLETHGQAIANTLLGSDRSVLAFDKRFLEEPAPFESESMRLPRLFRSDSVKPAAIDHLYSEIVLLDLKL